MSDEDVKEVAEQVAEVSVKLAPVVWKGLSATASLVAAYVTADLLVDRSKAFVKAYTAYKASS